MNFEFATATRVIYGPGGRKDLPSAAHSMGTRALVVSGANIERAEPVFAGLKRSGVETIPFQIATEPSTDLVLQGARSARNSECDFLIGIGGGSVIDGTKAIAALLTNDGDVSQYLEVVGQSTPIRNAAAPWMAIPTTAGTGAEVTKNAVLTAGAQKMKVSLRSPLLFARLAIIDPELTLGLPPALTASTGLDALTQLIEPYVSIRANPITDAFCVEGMRRCARSLRKCFEKGSDLRARSDLALASLLGGLALANAGLGAVHGFAAPIGGEFTAPHGAVCAALLPHVMTANIRALRRREPENPVLNRFENVGRLLTEKPQATAEDGIAWVRELCKGFGIPPLRSYGIQSGQLQSIVEKSTRASSMKANPIQLTSEELQDILEGAL